MYQLTQTGEEVQQNLDWKISKASGSGIKVDPDTPTFPWRDMEGLVQVKALGVGSPPALNIYQGNIREFQFSVNDEIYNTYHIPHDYVPGSDLFIHVHWSHIDASVTSGGVTWEFEVSYAKGHDQEPFSAPITLSIQQDADTTQYQHMIAEVQLSAASPSASQLDSDDIEVDGLILVHTKLSGNTINGTPEPFGHFVDIHYQSSGIGTKQKAPPFFV